MSSQPTSHPPAALSLFAKFVVLATFWLIFIGGHTTTTGAGMAFPDWPLSHGSVNPHGWWDDMMMRLEHGHRWTAGAVGILIGILCAWIWRSRWSVPIALLSAAVSGGAAHAIAKPMSSMKMAIVASSITGIVVSAAVFLVLLKRDVRKDPAPRPAALRWLAYAAFLGVCAQALLGGLRVIFDPEGIAPIDAATATTFRVFHGCVAQVELCLLVALAAQLSPRWRGAGEKSGGAGLAWVVSAAIFLQLIAGATMRHLGAGLAIPTFPKATADGSWLPAVHNLYVDLNFSHTRIGALLVTVLIFVLVLRLVRTGDSYFSRPAIALGVLLAAQIVLGVGVIHSARAHMVTTIHVVNGAAILAMAVLIAVRLRGNSTSSNPSLQSLSPATA